MALESMWRAGRISYVTYVLIDKFPSVFVVEEVPVAEDGVAEGLRCGVVNGVDGEVAGWGSVGDVEEDVFEEAGGVVVYEAGEECAAPVEYGECC